jgi:GT2 family glycosyltransferase
MLTRLLAEPAPPFELVVVDDSRMPPRLRRWVAAAARRRGIRLLLVDHAAGVNELRMTGFAAARTPYVAFVDNDVWLWDGSLEALLACARDTGAAFVAPVYCIGPRNADTVHHAFGSSRIDTGAGRSRLIQSHQFHGRPLSAVRDRLERWPCTQAELHCVLVRADALRAAGGLDAGLVGSMDCEDLALRLVDQPGGGWFEPDAVVTYDDRTPGLGDLRLYLSRWNHAQIERDIVRFAARWGLDLDDPGFIPHRRSLHRRRWKALRGPSRVARRVIGRDAVLRMRGAADRILDRLTAP